MAGRLRSTTLLSFILQGGYLYGHIIMMRPARFRRASAHARLVFSVLLVSSFSKALAMLPGGPPSVMSRLGIV